MSSENRCQMASCTQGPLMLHRRYFVKRSRISKLVTYAMKATCPRILLPLKNKTKKFRRPPPESDTLFNSTYEHVQGESTCEKCDQSQTVFRKPRDNNGVVIHYGTIPYGHRVIKNARERDSLSEKFGGVLCFEMEAAGLMNNFDCLVIRGICDYTDSHKNKEWQPYAAAVAAAFAKDLLVDIAPVAVIDTTVTSLWIKELFQSSQVDFLAMIKDLEPADFSGCKSVDDIYTAAEKIQKSQAADGTLCALKRISPYIDRLSEYVAVIEVLAEVKSEMIFLIWGSFKLLLQIFSSIPYAFNSIIGAVSDIGRRLPQFKKYVGLFEQNDHAKVVLSLFYREILDFHCTVLGIFKKRNTKLVFESTWPKAQHKIDFFQRNLDQYKILMIGNVTTEQIAQAYAARTRAYHEMQDDYDSRDRLNYQAVMTHLSPCFYEAELYKFQTDCSLESGKWLKEHNDFKRWLDPDHLTVRTLWLQGIPGAGKTVLAANTIRRMREAGEQVLFAFLTFDNKVQSSVVKVLHSLIFQLIQSYPTLWPILHERFIINVHQISGVPSYVEKLFTDLVRDSGPIFVVLDGVDEVEEVERKDLLSTLLRLKESCKNMKLLISSRAETDIAVLLKKRALSLRVDHNNSEDIELYINTQYDSWVPDLKRYGADRFTCSEIRRALEPLKERANGMFLYVKLVLFVVMAQDNLSDVQKEVQTLPNGLGQAYDRILRRIQTSSIITDKLAALTILLWIGCATYPLREEELLQALAIQHGARDFSKGRKALRDIQRTCGPFIEIENGVVRFVHFTAKEYIFGRQSDNFIRTPEAHWQIASTCLTYLSFISLNDIFSRGMHEEAQIRDKIVAGDFVLFQYAATQWIHHVTRCAKLIPPVYLHALCTTISEFLELRNNNEFLAGPIKPSSLIDFRSFQSRHSMQISLAHVQDFLNKLEKGLLHTDEKNWVDADPTMTSAALVQLRWQIENLLCPGRDHRPGCSCQVINDLYGINLYRCDRPFCRFYRTGFATRIERDEHRKIHSRPYKCSDPGCPFAKLGFRSQSDLTRHSSEHRIEQYAENGPITSASTDRIPKPDLAHLLKDAVCHDQIDHVRQLLQSAIKANFTLLQECAAKYASSAMVRCIRDEATKQGVELNIEDALSAAISAENVLTLRTLITDADLIMTRNRASVGKMEKIFRERMRCAFNVGNVDIMDMLVDHGKLVLPSDCPPQLLKGIIFSKRNEIEKARRLLSMKKYIIWPQAFTDGVTFATVAGSITSLQFCLDNGGSANSRANSKRSRSRSVLWECGKRGTTRHAEVVKLLLQHGADPGANDGITRLKGMRKIEKYFKMSWSELIMQTQPGK
ncbi:hypothetical protein K469DRAFT_801445 [Zopfia rhizophila CBS 207.26]|uniref:NACHT domain-containing protein n=1 Tax=Zopfia rhizophila CBS 207.26 TaxID=1314779 RepID=A0A6A6DJ48_9PEZI|nr:hypothetical protein K469DRAFT_801445 [Zopfia rhizophila CBS 207.26]